MGWSAAFDLRELQPADDPTEQACNRIAAEYLVPESQLHRIWPSIKQDPEPFQAIARRFKVSVLVASRRALDLQLIRKAEFLEFYRAYQEDERRRASQRSGSGDFYSTQNARVGRRFAQKIVRAVKEGRLLYSEAYRLTELYGTAFDRYAATIGSGKSQ